MFERGPAFNTKTDFKGTVLARYPRDRSPLASGYLCRPRPHRRQDRRALDADVGKGHVILLGFKPQWRGQSHAAYKFFFNALYIAGIALKRSETCLRRLTSPRPPRRPFRKNIPDQRSEGWR